MDIKEKAKKFAIEAHKGQIRKSEPDKPKVMHPIAVGNLLEEYGFDDDVIAAGYLHDVVEDTKYTIEDIENEFGKDIRNLVEGATEPDKSLSWEERRLHTIRTVKDLPLKNKMLICADKINNLEDLFITFEKNGVRDFSSFNAGEEKIKWYYTNIYKSLIYGEDESLPMFQRLKDVIDKFFYNKENNYLRETIFQGDEEYYEKLKKLHAAKKELLRLKSLSDLDEPYVIEFTGTPRTGKTTILNNLYDFFKKGGFDISRLEEFTTSNYYKNILKPSWSNLSKKEININIIESILEQLLKELKKQKDIILVDSSINDRQIWFYTLLKHGDISFSDYDKIREYYKYLSKDLIDFLVVTKTDSLTALKRDYISSLSLEDRHFLNIQNLEEFNTSLDALGNLFKDSTGAYSFMDATDKNIRDLSVDIASEVMPDMRKKYIKSFKNRYNLR